MLKFGFVMAKVVLNVEVLYYIRLLELGRPRCVKEGKSCGKGFLALNCCFSFNS